MTRFFQARVLATAMVWAGFLLLPSGGAGAAEPLAAYEYKSTDDDFAVTAWAEVKVQALRGDAELRSYFIFADPESYAGPFVVYVQDVNAGDQGDAEAMLRARLPKGAGEVVKVSQSGLAGLQFARVVEGDLVLGRLFVKGGRLYSLVAVNMALRLAPGSAEAAQERCWEWLNSWRILEPGAKP